ncbi:MarR family winged helix-turn-helix transcriptional regulator [Viridibacillus arvi]|uniref:MarR family winged helix-turn-helix transcriptional regulator n=1 Tax=Viridibacillus arvi TaxID=263475 RepID=UPI0036DFFC15
MDKNVLFNKWVSFTTSVHSVTHELTKDAKSDSITPVQYNILEAIAVSTEPVSPSEISDCLHLSMPNTSRELKKLSEKNLIEKVSDTKDRRKQYILLSKEGEAMMNETFKLVESRFLDRIQHASEEDLEDIDRALDVLQSKMFY